MYRRRNRFGGRPQKVAIEAQPKIATKRQRCSGCTVFITPGESCTRFVLRKQYRRPCVSCGNEPRRSRWYHEHCKPADIDAVNKAMGYNPTAAHVHDPVGTAPPVNSAAPPKPVSAKDLTINALSQLEAALVAQLRERSVPLTPELAKAFKTFQGIKGHVLRPGNVNEEHVATKNALKRIIDMAWN